MYKRQATAMCRYQALLEAEGGGGNGELLSLLFHHHLEFFLEASCPVEAVRAELTLGEMCIRDRGHVILVCRWRTFIKRKL